MSRRIAVITVVALTWLAPGAFAYWSNAGEGSAEANLATLSAPAITSATTGAETVTLSWSAVTPPGEGTVEYYVTRDGSTASAGCPSSSSHSTATSCTDTNVPVGAHKYKVTAVWRSWTSTGVEQTVTVAYGPATHLVLEAASTTPAAGEADNLTITAKDATGDTVGTYSGSHSLIFEGASVATSGEEPVVLDSSGVEQNFGEATEITFSEGKATVSSAINGVMKLYKAEAAHIKVKEGLLNNSTGLAVTVKAAVAKRFSVPTPSEQEAGVAFNVTLTAIDEWGNTATSYAGKKTIAWSEPANSPNAKAPSYTASVTFTAGVGAAASTKLYDAQSTTLKAKEGTIEGTTGAFTVRAAVAKKFTVPTPSEPEAGVAFNVTLTAIDEYGNTATGYAGSKTLAWSGPANSPNATAPEYPATATAVTFTAGVGTASALKLYDAQSTTLKAKEGTIEGTTPASFTVKAAGAASFSVPTPAEQTAGTAFNVTLTAWDPWHNIAKSYAGAKTLAFSEPSSSPNGKAPVYPATVTFTSGAGTASIKLYDAQTTTLKITEGAIEGTTGAFTVKAAATKKFTVPTPSEQEAGVAFNVTLTATDEYGNLSTSYTGAKTIAWSGPSNSPNATAPEYPTSATTVTFTAGVGTASALKLYDAQSTTLKAKEGSIEGTSSSFTVKAAATTKKFTVPTPSEQTAGAAFNVTLTAIDEWGNKATGYTGAKTLVWSGPSSSPSGQAPSYPSTATTVIFTAGEGTATLLTLYDAQSTTLKATEGSSVEGTSAAFTVKAGTATTLSFTTSPSTPTAENTAFATQPKVTVQDAWQNTAATNTSNVTLTPSGATVTCTANPKAAVAGVATFAGCKMKTAGTYTLTATDGTLTSVLSSPFTIS